MDQQPREWKDLDLLNQQYTEISTQLRQISTALGKLIRDGAATSATLERLLEHLGDSITQSNVPRGEPLTGKVPFDEGLRYITGQPRPERRLERFLLFLESQAKPGLSSGCPEILARRLTSRFAAMFCPELWELFQQQLQHPARLLFDEFKYEGFLAGELPTLKALYLRWWQDKANAQAIKNLHVNKEKRRVTQKIA
jgi:hypothetical protein